jgi:hypothetical protein
MHMHDRYKKKVLAPTFEYEKQFPWGKGHSTEAIAENYLELQNREKNKDLDQYNLTEREHSLRVSRQNYQLYAHQLLNLDFKDLKDFKDFFLDRKRQFSVV